MKNKPSEKTNLGRLIIKITIILLASNLLFVFFQNIPYGNVSLYNFLFTGRQRLPFGESSEKSFNLTMSNIDAMVSSHIAAKKNDNEYRIFVFGDSSIWGILQKPQETLTGILNNQMNSRCRGKDIVFYNFGYPSLSVLKDLLIIERVKMLDPDLIIWAVTLESMLSDVQMDTPLVANNPQKINQILASYELNQIFSPSAKILAHTIVHERRNLADIIRLQAYGVMWSATGIDQDYPVSYTPAMWDLEDNTDYYDVEPFFLEMDDLALDIIKNGVKKNDHTNFIIINEPILISTGSNSDIRYNFYYPRWAYDQYQILINEEMNDSGIEYYDFWNLVPGTEFTNSAIHLNDVGENLLAKEIKKIIESRCD